MKAGIVLSISVACIFLVAVFGGFSCGPDRNLFGHWEGNRDWHQMDGVTEEASRSFAAVDLDLNSDGSFLVRDSGVPVTGVWSQHGTSINLEAQTIFNRPMDHAATNLQKTADYTVRFEKGHMYFRTAADSTDIEMEKKTKP